MIKDLASHIYPNLPVFAQNAACTLYGYRERQLRFGGGFQKKLDSLQKSQWWSRGEIEAYQDEQVKELIAHAYHHVPYYRSLMRRRGLSPRDIRATADLPKLPITTREDVIAHTKAMFSDTARPGRLLACKTSGTTGKAMRFYLSREATQFIWAVWWRHRMSFGVELGDRHANFTGQLVVPPGQAAPPYWRWNAAFNQAIINMHHINPAKIERIVDFLDQQDFVFYSGYPSNLHSLAICCEEQGLRLSRPPSCVFTGAENLYAYQKKAIAKLTRARVSDHYGSAEGCGNASQCEHGRYHQDFELGFMECVAPRPSEGGGREGRIVCTGFACREFPLIRYALEDLAVWDDHRAPCACGRQSPTISSIAGRQDDYILTPEGNRIMRLDSVFNETVNVKEGQVVQNRLGEITLRLVKRAAFRQADERAILRQVHWWISPRLKVNFEYVSEIERTAQGKFKAVVSRLGRAAPGA